MEIAQAVLLSIAAVVMIVSGIRLSHFVGKREEIADEQREVLVLCGLQERRIAALETKVDELIALVPRPQQ